jgi:hypothetical protein
MAASSIAIEKRIDAFKKALADFENANMERESTQRGCIQRGSLLVWSVLLIWPVLLVMKSSRSMRSTMA